MDQSGLVDVTLTGTLAQINNLLAGIDSGQLHRTRIPSTLTLTVHDNGNTGSGDLVSVATATINISAVNDAGGHHASYAATEQVISDVDAGSVDDGDAGCGRGHAQCHGRHQRCGGDQ